MGKVLDEHGGERNRLVMQLDEFEGTRYLDARFWYFHKGDQEWRRTRKGVALTKDRYRVLKNVISSNDEEIMTWIGEDFVPEEITRYEEAMAAAAEDSLYQAVGMVVGWIDERRDPNFFRVVHEGGTSRLLFNRAHPMVQQLEDLPQESLTLVAKMVVAFDRARGLLAGSPAFDSETLLSHLEMDWGKFLRDAVEDDDD